MVADGQIGKRHLKGDEAQNCQLDVYLSTQCPPSGAKAAHRWRLTSVASLQLMLANGDSIAASAIERRFPHTRTYSSRWRRTLILVVGLTIAGRVAQNRIEQTRLLRWVDKRLAHVHRNVHIHTLAWAAINSRGSNCERIYSCALVVVGSSIRSSKQDMLATVSLSRCRSRDSSFNALTLNQTSGESDWHFACLLRPRLLLFWRKFVQRLGLDPLNRNRLKVKGKTFTLPKKSDH